MFSLLGLVLVLRGSRVVVEHHHQQMVTHQNNFQTRVAKLIMFFCIILPTYLPYLSAWAARATTN